ncbi:bifunctional (p)ppGpp synthetase/guanosine-3',5'-bis(diphosphate) 3'-pyrophosphohydrolase [Streptomyces sp. KAI-26]|uniref:RelA/SpoT family protein n=1 Tax=Streptomyces TaxID=1883 RepID=UPI0015879159|nr:MULTISPECIES: HD domain-containing protein [unclassified Streptomyces]NUV82659.1 bifunctional (p)ppGpp synthetase/guanosine-3',5'-bis(diphosphate) 3'-pyrophosphohydrolase [Streptomyces sp. CAI-155]NUV89353.1 bifunctional (p)ppGpp synthetase/guanosine-3',5'-bis(diphosphate) 3'-pyrophosphohydrolase [Streptomyces sp. KAI-26]NUW23576.1 bifunctional (p)ppGpp synthetase/guanosine-3',5'-bis(diphosphate) 3'-pyrophosphohydrolase [Streptomyces roseoviolaceus]
MSAEAADPAAVPRRRSRPRIELRRLGRVALLGPVARDRLPAAISHVAEAHRAHHPDADLAILHRAYVLAESSHRGQMRKSGEPYITHPLAVTLILAELGAETTTLTASLLHDTVEDTEVTLDQVGEQFGEEVRYLVDGVTKLEKVDYGAAAEPETFRKMLVATGNDVRVMSIKLADRLHNMRTLTVMRPEKQARIAKVTRDVLIPLAERLGVQALKTELEDLVFAILDPEGYEETRALIAGATGGEDPLSAIAGNVRTTLREAGITAEVLIRPRHFVSVHRVRRKRGELRPTDFGRLLVLVGEDADCYAVLGELHTCFTPVVSEFKDFIAAPKFNLYQSLHTAVVGPGGAVAEVLIRTHRMHKVAEAGVVALGNPYAQGPAAPQTEPSDERADPTRPGWLSRLLDWQESATDPDTFWTTLRADLAQDREITVFRTDGRTLGLPAGASCVDAAYAQHGERAHACIGARVNGRLATLSTVLSDGDTVQLLLAQDTASGPSPEWLDHARTPAARIAITGWLTAHPEAAGPEAGDPEASGPEAPDSERPDAVPAAGGAGAADDRTEPAPGGPQPAAPARTRSGGSTSGVVVDGPDSPTRLAGCCTPVPPDEVVGIVIRGGAVTVHRQECPAVARMREIGRAPVAARWRHEDGGGDTAGCRVTLVAESFGRPRLLADLTEAIATADAAIVSATVEPPSEQRVRHTYTLQLPDAAGLPALMRAMREVAGVYDVTRAQHPAATG